MSFYLTILLDFVLRYNQRILWSYNDSWHQLRFCLLPLLLWPSLLVPHLHHGPHFLRVSFFRCISRLEEEHDCNKVYCQALSISLYLSQSLNLSLSLRDRDDWHYDHFPLTTHRSKLFNSGWAVLEKIRVNFLMFRACSSGVSYYVWCSSSC